MIRQKQLHNELEQRCSLHIDTLTRCSGSLSLICMPSLLHSLICHCTGNSGSSDTHESIKALALLAHQVEVLFVMCTLLAGKRKVQVQDRLMELDIVPALLQMFDRLDWNRAPSTSPPMERSVPLAFKNIIVF